MRVTTCSAMAAMPAWVGVYVCLCAGRGSAQTPVLAWLLAPRGSLRRVHVAHAWAAGWLLPLVGCCTPANSVSHAQGDMPVQGLIGHTTPRSPGEHRAARVGGTSRQGCSWVGSTHGPTCGGPCENQGPPKQILRAHPRRPFPCTWLPDVRQRVLPPPHHRATQLTNAPRVGSWCCPLWTNEGFPHLGCLPPAPACARFPRSPLGSSWASRPPSSPWRTTAWRAQQGWPTRTRGGAGRGTRRAAPAAAAAPRGAWTAARPLAGSPGSQRTRRRGGRGCYPWCWTTQTPACWPI